MTEPDLRRALRRLPSGRSRGGEEEARELGRVLLTLGPFFVAFGRFLGTRPDLLGVETCVRLLELEDRLPVAPWAAVEEQIARSLGSPERVFAELDRSPREVRYGLQVHAGTTLDGELVEVLVCVTARGWRRLGRLLPRVVRWLATDSSHLAALTRAAASFVAELEASFDVERQRVALGDLAGRGAGLSAPRPIADLSRGSVLTLRREGGRSLSALALEKPPDSRELAESCVAAILEQALSGGWLPPSHDRRDLAADGRRWVLSGGPLIETSRAFGEDLAAYLRRVAVGDPDGAAERLVPLLQRLPSRRDAVRETLRMTGASPPRGPLADDPLVRDLVEHWQRLRQVGAEPRPAFVGALRGIFSAVVSAQQLAPGRDLAGAAFERVQTEALWHELGGQLSAGRLGAATQRWVAALPLVPVALDGAFERLAGDRTDRSSPPGRRRGLLRRLPVLLTLFSVAAVVAPLSEALDSATLAALLAVALAALLGRRLAE